MNRHRHQKSLRHGLLTLLLLAAPPPNAQETQEPIGRLFFHPEHRQNLDLQRQNNIKEIQVTPVEPMLTINGIVTRSNGKRTVWVNGTTQNEQETQSGVTITPDGKIIVRVAESPAGHAKIGDTVNRTTGEAAGLLNGGTITIKTTPSK